MREAFSRGSLARDLMLFGTFFRIASVVVGGGFAIIAAAGEEFVRRRKLLTSEELLEIVTVTQTVPGIVACNAAICIGFRINGKAGAFAAALGAVLPSMIVITLIAAGMSAMRDFLQHPAVRGAFRGVIAGIVALISVTAFRMRRKAVVDLFGAAVAAAAFVGIAVLRIAPPWIILGAIAAGAGKVLAADRAAKKKAGKGVRR